MISELKAFEVRVASNRGADVIDESTKSILAADVESNVLNSKLHVNKNGFVSNTEAADD
jgi:hypothetical protein